MARYRVKDDIDLTWNRIRRGLTRELDTNIQNFREELLNKLLGDAWNEYATAIESGEKLELESGMKDWVTAALEANIKQPLER